MEGYILGKLASEDYIQLVEYCKQWQFETGWEEELQEMTQRVTGENMACNSWRLCINALIKWSVINKYQEEKNV